MKRYFICSPIHLVSSSAFSRNVPPSNDPILTLASKDRTREAELSDARNASNDRSERLRQPCRSSPSSRSAPASAGGWFSLSDLAAFFLAYASALRCVQSLHVFAYPERVCANSDGFRSLVFRQAPHFCVGAGLGAGLGAPGAEPRIWLGI